MTREELLDKIRIAIGDLRHAYRMVFKGPNADVVLKDLALFCRAHETTFTADERTHALLEGRREVWLKIQNQLQLTPDQLWKLYQGRQQGQ